NFYNALVSAVEYGVQDKILFGSDYPFFTTGKMIDSLRAINHLAKERIFLACLKSSSKLLFIGILRHSRAGITRRTSEGEHSHGRTKTGKRRNRRQCERRQAEERGLFSGKGFVGIHSRSFTKSMGYTEEDIRKPVIGICNTFSELNKCHSHFNELVDYVKRGVWQAGGVPMEFPTISIGEPYVKPTTMLLRNLMAMDTEKR
ncbi:dihydroxy-acid dehydratase domain-containing protein, partial [Cohnella faecalis]|uniref:dihydroxy-acid dehydratase domain-containing protein n=1 Tax=Cohnella faecalis TaxID=2315694 RepID=UPI0022780E35